MASKESRKSKKTAVPQSRVAEASKPLTTWELLRPWLARNWPLTVILVATLLVQLPVYLGSAPNVFPDTWTYAGLAENLLKGRWEGYGDTSLTPGYPAFLAVGFAIGGVKNYATVMALQFLLGSFIPLALYATFLRVSRRKAVAVVAGLGFLLDRYSVGLQTVPLTEPMSMITLIAALAAFSWAVEEKRNWTAPVVGLLLLVNLLVRPSFQYLFVCIVFAGILVELCYREIRGRWKQHVLWYALLFLTVQAGVWGWSAVTYSKSGSFGLTAQVYGYLTNQTGYFLELAPDKYATVRDYYVRERKRRGKNTNLLIEIIGPMVKDTGLTREEIERQFEEMNRYLIRAHPLKYAEQIRATWRRMWLDDSRYITDITDPDGSGTGKMVPTAFFRTVTQTEWLRRLYLPWESFYWSRAGEKRRVATPLILSFLAVGAIIARRRDRVSVVAIGAVFGSIMYHMLLHAMVQATEFGRYRLPVQALWMAFGLGAFALLVDWAGVRLGWWQPPIVSGAPKKDPDPPQEGAETPSAG